jgi:hypothetical protein
MLFFKLRNFIRCIADSVRKPNLFPGSVEYWEQRYAEGGTSGDGSYNQLAEFKAEVINNFVSENSVETVIEFGCGDGNQLVLCSYPQYIGFDVSSTALDICRNLHWGDSTKAFKEMEAYQGEKASLTLSLDVILHLVENAVFNAYMERLFDSSEHYVIVYSSDFESKVFAEASHVRHRKFTNWISEFRSDWILDDQIANKYPFKGDTRVGSLADFYIYKRRDSNL